MAISEEKTRECVLGVGRLCKALCGEHGDGRIACCLNVFEQRAGIVVYSDQPGRLEKTGDVLVWMKKDRMGEKHSREGRS